MLPLIAARRASFAILLVALWGGLPAWGLEMRPVSRGVYRGPAPRSAADYRRLQQLGIRTVLDLRKHNRFAVARERRALRARGIAHRHVPMGYRQPSDQTLRQALAIISNPALQPVYVHCKQGRDRSGLVVGVFRVRHQGWTPSTAYREMERLGFRDEIAGLRRCFWLNCPEEPRRRIAESRLAEGRRKQESGTSRAKEPAADVAATPSAGQATPEQVLKPATGLPSPRNVAASKADGPPQANFQPRQKR
ncbi:MAG: tyrosine-protein phosphatase [Pirellulales bacterium]